MYLHMRFVFVYVDGVEVEVINRNCRGGDVLILLLLTRIKNRHCRKSVIGYVENTQTKWSVDPDKNG
jgi:hypothetical protein